MENILLVEDDLNLIYGLEYSLKKSGFNVDIARTVLEAFSFYEDGKYDLLVLDLTLPDGTGFEICKKVRLTSTVPIIFLTASDEEVNVVMGLDIGGALDTNFMAGSLPAASWAMATGALRRTLARGKHGMARSAMPVDGVSISNAASTPMERNASSAALFASERNWLMGSITSLR